MAGIRINGPLDVRWPSLLDGRSGKLDGSVTVPYDTKEEALDYDTGVHGSYRSEGLILYIRNDENEDLIDHWQFMGGTDDEHLVKLEFGNSEPPAQVPQGIAYSSNGNPLFTNSTNGAEQSLLVVPYYTPFTGWRLCSTIKFKLVARIVPTAAGNYVLRLVHNGATELFTTGAIALPGPGIVTPVSFEVDYQPAGGYVHARVVVGGIVVKEYFEIGIDILGSFLVKGSTTTSGSTNSIVGYMSSSILAW